MLTLHRVRIGFQPVILPVSRAVATAPWGQSNPQNRIIKKKVDHFGGTTKPENKHQHHFDSVMVNCASGGVLFPFFGIYRSLSLSLVPFPNHVTRLSMVMINGLELAMFNRCEQINGCSGEGFGRKNKKQTEQNKQ